MSPLPSLALKPPEPHNPSPPPPPPSPFALPLPLIAIPGPGAVTMSWSVSPPIDWEQCWDTQISVPSFTPTGDLRTILTEGVGDGEAQGAPSPFILLLEGQSLVGLLDRSELPKQLFQRHLLPTPIRKLLPIKKRNGVCGSVVTYFSP